MTPDIYLYLRRRPFMCTGWIVGLAIALILGWFM